VAQKLTLHELQSFFRNPARVFFEEVLAVRLERPDEAALSDEEMFQADQLEEYNRNALALEHLYAGRADTLLPDLLREAGLAPLGAPGRIEARALARKVRNYLAAPWKPVGRSVRELLDIEGGAQGVTLRCKLDKAEVAGEVRLFAFGPGRAQLFRRYSGVKAKDRIAAWIAHLLACAASDGSVATFVLGREGAAPAGRAMAPLARGRARELLGGLLSLRETGMRTALPFAPETSLAYASQIRKPEEEAAGRALARAAEQWTGGTFQRGEVEDAHFRLAWGEAGPQGDGRFARIAEEVWAPCLAQEEAGRAAESDPS
jgi:exodeoxyribonuclease V gamma subunit